MNIKHHVTILIAAAALLIGTFSNAQQSLVAVHREGVALFNAGNYEEAMIKFDQVLRAQPSYINSRVYKNKCQLAITQNRGPKKDIGDSLASVMIPTVDFQEVPLGDAITYIRQRTMELTEGKITPNIIFNGSAEQREASLVTIKMNRVPAKTLLEYIGKMTRCKIQYDEHAILITPYDNAPQTVAAPEAAAPNPFQ